MSNAPSSRGRWLTLVAALLGWMFDGMEMGLFPLVGKDSLRELLHIKERVEAFAAVAGFSAGAIFEKQLETDEVNRWYGVIMACFLVGAATGGVLFGWLGDKIGRVKAMTVSVLLYSLCSGMSAASQTPAQMAVLRFLGALGMGGEWALGVALVMEVWPNASRAWLAGWIGAFGNLGYTLVGTIALTLNRWKSQLPDGLKSLGIPDDWAAALTANNNWRLLMLVGAIPALLTLVIRLFVDESEKWEKGKAEGKASFWAGKDLLGVLLGCAAAGGVITLWAIPSGDLAAWIRIAGSILGLAIVLYGYMLPARGYLSRCGFTPEVKRESLIRMFLAAGLSGVPLLATWAGLMWMYQWVGDLPGGKSPDAKPWIQISSSIGAALGCLVGAVLGGMLGRRPVYAALCLLSMVTMIGFYGWNTEYGMVFILSAGLLGLVSASFYGWLPLYLPELFRTSMRATGQGFGFNFGRIIAAAANLQMANLLLAFDNNYSHACAIVAGIYFFGLVLIYFAPETKGKPLPE